MYSTQNMHTIHSYLFIFTLTSKYYYIKSKKKNPLLLWKYKYLKEIYVFSSAMVGTHSLFALQMFDVTTCVRTYILTILKNRGIIEHKNMTNFK